MLTTPGRHPVTLATFYYQLQCLVQQSRGIQKILKYDEYTFAFMYVNYICMYMHGFTYICLCIHV